MCSYIYICFAEFQKVYERLNVTLIERGESFYQNKMKDLVDSLEKEGLYFFLFEFQKSFDLEMIHINF